MKAFCGLLFFVLINNIYAQNKEYLMEKSYIKTRLGDIAVFTKSGNPTKTPVLFVHGVYFDHHLWDHQIAEMQDRKVIAIDMPWHGDSKKNIPSNWDLKDCGNMLVEILDSLQINQVIAIGHSWGSMSILRACSSNPEKFISVGFCNMPIEKSSLGKKISFQLQHSALAFRKFYTKKAAESLFGKSSLKQNPTLIDTLARSMNLLTAKQIRLTDKYVILNAENTSQLIENLKVHAIAIKGEEDYVPTIPQIETIIVKGGHISPLEAINEVNDFCRKVIININK